MNKLFETEKEFFNDCHIPYVCGVDEVGRGPLAGPVFACAYMPNYENILDEVNDSKKISLKKRNILYELLADSSICHSTISVSPQEIDKFNILNATKMAMTRAIESLFPFPQRVLVDAVNLNHPFYNCIPIVKGDEKCYSIACASIIAKVERDELMCEYAHKYPEYGFEEHKGYGTKHHIEMLKKYGPCEIHRLTFIKNFI